MQFSLIRMEIETEQPAVQCCADVHFFGLIRMGVSTTCVYLWAGDDLCGELDISS